MLVDKARASGIAALAINHCVHFAALWPEIEAITTHGLVALACTPSHAWVAPAGGSKPLFGTNPIAFGWPRPGPYPFVFDFATSAVAPQSIRKRSRPAVTKKLVCRRPPLPNASPQPSTRIATLAIAPRLFCTRNFSAKVELPAVKWFTGAAAVGCSGPIETVPDD